MRRCRKEIVMLRTLTTLPAGSHSTRRGRGATMVTAGIAAMLGAVTIAVAANTPEVEPNDNKAGAQLVAMACGDTITGNSTGTSTTVPVPDSADYFVIRTVATGGITEYTLTMTSGAATPPQG